MQTKYETETDMIAYVQMSAVISALHAKLEAYNYFQTLHLPAV